MDQDLKDYLDRQFTELRQGMDRRFEKVDRRFEETNRRFEETNGEVAGLRDEVHQTRIVAESLNDKIDLVAEGVSANTEVMHRLHEENRREPREDRNVLEAAHRHLESRVSRHDDDLEKLDVRVAGLEAARA